MISFRVAMLWGTMSVAVMFGFGYWRGQRDERERTTGTYKMVTPTTVRVGETYMFCPKNPVQIPANANVTLQLATKPGLMVNGESIELEGDWK